MSAAARRRQPSREEPSSCARVSGGRGLSGSSWRSAGTSSGAEIAVAGSGSYANWSEQLLSWKECEPSLDGFCAEAGLPADAAGFTAALRAKLEQAAAATDAEYPDNSDLVIDNQGVPTLKPRPARQRRAGAVALEAQLKRADATACWLRFSARLRWRVCECHRRRPIHGFSPSSRATASVTVSACRTVA